MLINHWPIFVVFVSSVYISSWANIKSVALVPLSFTRDSLTSQALNWTLDPCDFGRWGSSLLIIWPYLEWEKKPWIHFTQDSIPAATLKPWKLSRAHSASSNTDSCPVSCEIFYKRSNFLWKIRKVRQVPRRPGVTDVSIVTSSNDQRAIQAVRHEGHRSDSGFWCLFKCWDENHMVGSKASVQLFFFFIKWCYSYYY